MSGTSAECTQRTVRSSPASPATSRGAPRRTGSRASTSRTVGNTSPVTPRPARIRPQVAAQLVEGDGRRGRHVERVDAAVHRDGHPLIAGGQRGAGQPRPLGAEQQRRPPPLRTRSAAGSAARRRAGVSASRLKPASRTASSACGHGSNRAYGTANTSPMLTRTLRR